MASPVSLLRWPPSQPAEKNFFLLFFFSSHYPGFPRIPPSLCYVMPGLFLQLSTSLLGGNPTLGILRCEDRRRGGKRALPACLSGALHAAWSNNAVSISWCVPMCCMPDPLGRKEREPSSGRGQQQCSHHGWLVFTVQNPGAILDQKRLPLLMASSPAHDPQSPIIILS